MQRNAMLLRIAKVIHEIRLSHPVRVGIDGVSAAGKTVFANELAHHIESLGRPVVRAGIDGFHNPPEIRYQQGPMSIPGYVEDSFNYDAVIEHVLVPMGPQGNRKFIPVIHDLMEEGEVGKEHYHAPDDAVLIFEGVMLFCDTLADFWDFQIFIDVSFDVVIKRALTRDAKRLGGVENLLEKYHNRYIPGQQLYLETYQPREAAHVVINNDNFAEPKLVKMEIHLKNIS